MLLRRLQHQVELAEALLLDAEVRDQIDVGAEDAERFGIDDQLRLGVPPAVGGFDVVILADRGLGGGRAKLGGCSLRSGSRPRSAQPGSGTSRYASLRFSSDIRIENIRCRIPDLSDTPAVVAAVQAAHIHPSTPGRRLVELAKQHADAVRESCERRP